jgi:hypothetical protein
MTRRFFNYFFAYLFLICIIGQNQQKLKVHMKTPGHRPYELLPSGFVRRPLFVRRRLSLAFHILIFSSENTEPI